MIFHNQFSQNLGTYHDVFSYHLQVQHWDLGKFKIVLNNLVRKHPILRTSFSLTQFSVPLQLVHREAEIPVVLFNVVASPTSIQDSIISDLIEQERKTSFDLELPPLLRIFIHLRSPNTIQYTLSFHHAIFTAGALPLFWQTELFREYAFLCGATNDYASSSRPLASSFKEAVAQERRTLQSLEAKSFWKNYLSGCSFCSLPPLLEEADDSSLGSFQLLVPTALKNDLIKLANTLSVPIRAVLLAAYLHVVSMLSGQRDVVAGIVSHVRPTELDGEKVLGMFLNTLPFRQTLRTDSWANLFVPRSIQNC